MVNALFFQWKILWRRKECHIAFAVMLTYCVGSFAYSAFSLRHGNTDVAFCADGMFCINGYAPLLPYFSFLYPLLVALPCVAGYYIDTESGILPVLLVRHRRSAYYIAKALAAFLTDFLIVLLPLLLNLLLCHIAFPDNGNFVFGQFGSVNFENQIFGFGIKMTTDYPAIPLIRVFLSAPVIYNILYAVLMATFSGIFGVFVLCLSFVLKLPRPVLFLPVFLAFRLSELLKSIAFDAAMQDTSVHFINPSIMDYLTPLSYWGRHPRYLPMLFAALLLASIVMIRLAMRRDIIKDGAFS